jgi:two-component system, NarL family, nitrate/nitrite response regulator NarL
VLNIELLLRSQLVKDALSAVLIAAGFSVFNERDPDNRCGIVIIDVDDCRDREFVQLLRQRGARVVALADEPGSRGSSAAEIMPLSGVLTHEVSADDLVQALRRIGAGERVFPDDWVLQPGAPTPSSDIELQSANGRLSASERQLLGHVVAGHSDTEIAHRLGMTEGAVKLDLKALFSKIKVDNRTQATIWSLTNLPELDPNPHGFV